MFNQETICPICNYSVETKFEDNQKRIVLGGDRGLFYKVSQSMRHKDDGEGQIDQSCAELRSVLACPNCRQIFLEE